MKNRYLSRTTPLLSIVVPLALAVSLSGCTLLGLGAAAGAVVGGCSLLDENQDEQVTEAELAAGIHDSWDADNDGVLTEAEFEAGVDRRDRYAGWSGEFDDWDADNDTTVTQSEFQTGVANTGGTQAWLDDECDDLGL